MTPSRYPADTPSQQRTAIHAMIDRVLDARPDLEAGVVDLFSAVAQKVATPGALATMQLLSAGKRLFDGLDKPPAEYPPGRGGFTAR